MSGRHVDPGSGTFLRDLVVMLVGIAFVGLLVFGGLWLLSGRDDARSSPPPTPGPTTSVIGTQEPTTMPSTTAASTSSTAASSTSTSTTVPEVRDPSQVTVLVLNSIGVPGLASQASEQLTQAGYATLPPDNYTGATFEMSRVWYTGDFGPEAFELAGRFFPDALVEVYPESPVEADVVVVLGSSYQG